MNLRPYQADAVAQVRDLEYLGVPGICLQAPTGAGKTVCIAELLRDDRPQVLFTHRRVLLDQLSRELTKCGVDHGFRAAGIARNPAARVQLAMIQTEAAVLKQKKWPIHPGTERIIVDEIHANAGPSAISVYRQYISAGAKFVGVTATPAELSHLCKAVVVAATVPELISDGYLVPPVIYTPDGPSVQRLESVARGANGEFQPKALEKVWNPRVIFGRVLEHYQKYNTQQKPAILFAPGVPDSLWFAQKLTRAGVPAAHIDGKNVWMNGEFVESDRDARETLFRAVRTGEIKIICNRFVLREGFDMPEIEHVILACIFGTRGSYVQACGRGLRPAPGKTRCLFQDHGGNFWRFPHIASDDPWDITISHAEAQKRYQAARRGDDPNTPAEPEPIVCPECDLLRVSGPECPECGHRAETRSRRVIELSGELKRQTGPIFPPRRITKTPGMEDHWARIFWSTRKNKPYRTFRQLYVWYAKTHNWQYPPRNLPLMPIDPADWSKKVGDVPMSALYGHPTPENVSA